MRDFKKERKNEVNMHLKPGNKIGAWGFRGEEGNSQDMKSRCSVIRWLPVQYRQVIKVAFW